MLESRLGDENVRTGGQPPLVRLFWNLFTFRFVDPLLRKAARGAKVTAEDTFDIAPADEAGYLCERLEREWNVERENFAKGQKPSLVRALVRSDGKHHLVTGIFALLEDVGRILQPMLFAGLLKYFADKSTVTRTDAWIYVVGIAMATVINALATPQINQRNVRSSSRWQLAARTLFYKKMMTLSHSKLAKITTGHVIELTGTDIPEIHHFIWQTHKLWLGPLKAACAFWFLYASIGSALAIGYMSILFMVPVQVVLVQISAKYAKKNGKLRDERIHLISEIISGMRIIKMYCWEKPFGELVSAVRKEQLVQAWYKNIYEYVLQEMHSIYTRLIGVVVILASVILENDLSFTEILPLLAILDVANDTLLGMATWGFKNLVHASAAISRVERFLLLEEKDDSVRPFLTPAEGGVSISLENVSAHWEQDKNILHDLNVSIKRGDMAVVIGHVGAGKSSLMQLLAREMPYSQGVIAVEGLVIHSKQQAWIYPGTVRENVLFGNDYDPVRLQEVLNVTALHEDLRKFPKGDQTIVGDRGITLSGGQKARLGLARAIYQQADIYLLDDPLSAVDTAVGRHVFERCIMGYLRSKTRVLVTHQLQFAKDADLLVVMDQGTIMCQGAYQAVLNANVDLKKLLPDAESPQLLKTSSTRTHHNKACQNGYITKERGLDEPDARGDVWDIMKTYFSFNKRYSDLLFVILLSCTSRLMYYTRDWWLAAGHCSQDEECHISVASYITTVCVMTVSLFAVGMLRGMLYCRYTLTIANNSHDALYNSVVRSPIHLFDVNPSGRFLNRFSSDMNTMDNRTTYFIYEFIQQFTILAFALGTTVYVAPWLLLPCAGLIYYTYTVRNQYVKGRGDTITLESNAHSPILSHVKLSLEGLDTIRSMGKVDYCTDIYKQLLEKYEGLVYTNTAVFNWFNFRMMTIVGLFITCTAVTFMFNDNYSDPILLGLSLAYTLPLMGTLSATVRVSANIVMLISHVERVIQYCRLPPEAPLNTPEPPKNWPDSGKIHFDKVTFRYSPGDPVVLDNLTLEIKAKEKVGIVGRTGAGKSSLVQALFRMAEPEGSIFIDGINTSSLGLHSVRGNISVITQDPTLFSGPVRRNLDPFHEHSEEKIWMALEQVQMDDVIRTLAGSLDCPVTEGGANLSVGQRQLLCLARAILKQNNIIVMDEATANVDKKTDELIQHTVRESFQDSTILTVAHRLNSVMDCDRIMVIDSGRVVEYDAPHTLLQNPTGALTSLVAETGETEERRLRDLAEQAINKNILQPSNHQIDERMTD